MNLPRYCYQDEYRSPSKKDARNRSLAKFFVYIFVTVCLCALSVAVALSIQRGDIPPRTNNVVVYEMRPQESLLEYGVLVERTAVSVVEIATEPTGAEALLARTGESGAGGNAMLSSGVIWTKNGHIVTNYHVVKGSKTITVKLGNVNLVAQKLFEDEFLDLAILKVDAMNLTPVAIAKPDILNRVAVIGRGGNEKGFILKDEVCSKAGAGLNVPAIKVKPESECTTFERCFTGGGIFNYYGGFLGLINTNCSAGTSAGNELCAVPSQVIDSAVKGLLEKGYVPGRPEHDIFGLVQITEPDQVYQFSGLTVNMIYSGLPKYTHISGPQIQKLDVITKVNGTAVNAKEDWRVIVFNQMPNDQITIDFNRGGEQRTAVIRLTEKTE